MKLGVYRHYKGKDYKVIAETIDKKTGETFVLYKLLYGPQDLQKRIFARPKDEFLELIEINNKKVRRFEFLENDTNNFNL